MGDGQHHLEQASCAAQRAQQLLAQPANMDAYDWGLITALLVEAYDELQRAQEQGSMVQLPLFEIVMEELRDATSDFTKQDFVSASKAARRQKPDLFSPSR
jgi:hypothetical protein